MLSFFPIPRNKNDPPDRPILSSLSVLFCYHLGTVVKGSFVITVVRIPRTVLVYMCNALKEKVRQHLNTQRSLSGLQKSSSLENYSSPGDRNVTCDSGHSEGSRVLQVPSSPTPSKLVVPSRFCL